MKAYLKKFGLFAFMGAIPLAGLYLVLTMTDIKPLLTDSVSFDYKADLIAEAKLEQVDVLCVGSSIALNNIGSKAMQEYLGKDYTYYNFSSWGLTMQDLNIILPVLLEKYQPKVVLIASGPMDFEQQKVGMCTTEEFAWYINNERKPYFYFKNSDLYSLVQRKRTRNKYTKFAHPEMRIHLLMDEWGGSNLVTKRENFQWFRYDENLIKVTEDYQYEELKKLCDYSKSQSTPLVFVASPMKKKPNCEDEACKKFIREHTERTRKIVEGSGQTFVDMHSNHTYADSLFCDESHLVYGGPDSLSNDIVKEVPLRSMLEAASPATAGKD